MRVSKRRAAGAKHLADFPFGEPVGAIEYGGTEQVKLEDVKLFPGNPRVHDEAQLHKLARMIQATRTMTPLMLDANNRVLAGEGRLKAAKLLGMTTVPAIRALGLSEAEMQLYRMADNRAVELGTWDERLLAISIKGLQDLKPNFSLEASGWTFAELDIKLSSLSPPETADDGTDPADLTPESHATAASRKNDIWLLGLHRIMAGSCLDAEQMAALMARKIAQMVCQDSPYNVSVTKHVGGLGKIQHREFGMATGEMSRDEFLQFQIQQLTRNAEHAAPGSVIMSFMDWRSIDVLIAAGRQAGLELINMCVWVKNNGAMGSLYRSKYELIAIFKKPGAPIINNVQLGKFGRYRTNVWEAPGANSFGKTRMEELGAHPTPKNVNTIADAIRDVTHAGDIVIDSFLGSGTTLIAAERTGRIAYGMELDPLYVDVSVRRWQKFTGRQAVLEGDGRSFDDIAAARAAGA